MKIFKNTFIAIMLLVTTTVLGQDDYLNSDGTISNTFEKKMFVTMYNKNARDGLIYDFEEDSFIIISKYDCGDKEFKDEEIQSHAMRSSFAQLHKQISTIKLQSLDIYKGMGITDFVFKTNTICMSRTRRYHFKFKVEEIESFPTYLDIQELIEYVVVEKKNENIIHIKNF